MLNNTLLTKQTFGLFVILLLCFFIYLPGIQGTFIFDDFYNIVNNESLYIDSISFENLKNAAFSINSGPLRRPISMLSFAMNGYLGGITPSNIKITNIFIHLFNAILVFSLTKLTYNHLLLSFPDIKRNTLSPWLPLIVTSAWILHPINLTSILYSVQRMSSLASLFVFAGLNTYLWLRLKQIKKQISTFLILIALLFFTVLGMLSKESAILLPLFALCYELSILKFNSFNNQEKTKLVLFYKILVFFAFTALILILIKQPLSLFNGYLSRDFNLVERLFTETRVLWFYIFLLLSPRLSQFGLFHDDIVISTSLFSPISTLVSCIGFIALITCAVIVRKKHPILLLSCLLFFSAHSIESTIIPLEIAHEHRNYFASYAFLLSLFFSIIQLTPRRFHSGAVCCSLLVSFFLIITISRVSLWGKPFELTLVNSTHHPLSARSNFESARLYTSLSLHEEDKDKKQKFYNQAKKLFEKSYDSRNSHLSGLIGSIWLDSILEKKIDKNTFDLLIKNLSVQKITHKTIQSLQDFNKCVIFKECIFSNENVYNLILIAIKNPNIPQVGLDILSTELSITALSLGLTQESLAIVRDAAESSPNNQQLTLNYIAMLIHMKLFDNAEIKMKALEKLGLHENKLVEFNQLQKSLQQLKNDNI